MPANAPVNQYWSATVYDRATHALIRDAAMVEPLLEDARAAEERRRLGRHLLRPQAPAGQEANWVPTKPDGGFEVIFRFYGPEKPLFDKTLAVAGHSKNPVAHADAVPLRRRAAGAPANTGGRPRESLGLRRLRAFRPWRGAPTRGPGRRLRYAASPRCT